MSGRHPVGNGRLRWAAWATLFLVALALRAWRLTGWILNYDETHWLLYAMRPELLGKTMGSSYPRPDFLLAWLGGLSIRLVGPNELALRLWPAVFGALTVFPLSWFVATWTGNRAAGFWAAALLAVSPLHVYLSAQALPDTLAIFFLFCSLAGFAGLRQEPSRPVHYVVLCVGLALALLSKASALYLWAFLAIIGPLFLHGRRVRIRWYASLLIALVPFGVMVAIIKGQGNPLTFFEQPTVRGDFRIDVGRIGEQVGLFVRFFAVDFVPTAAGMWIAWRRCRRSLVWLGLLGLVVVTPTFRVNSRELLYLLPALAVFWGLAVQVFQTDRIRIATLGCVAVASLALDFGGIPVPPLGPSLSDQTTALLDRPGGWPSRDVVLWLQAHVNRDEAILATGLGFTDPAIFQLRRNGATLYPAASQWERLQDPSYKIRYVVFVDNYRLYAPALARYADTHFAIDAEARFPGYTIYDCQKEGRFVAYPDAFSSAATYVQRGMELLQRKQCGQAIEALQIAIRLEPDSVPTQHNLMAAYLECGRREDAVRLGQEILKRDPDSALINADMAILDLELGRIEDGLAQCRKNIRLNIAPAISYGVLGQLLEKRGDSQAARDAYEESLSFDPTNPVTLQLLKNLRAKQPSAPPARGSGASGVR